MSTVPAHLWVAVSDSVVSLRISGWANSVCSVDFKILVHELWQKGYRQYVFDLSDCRLMDSTFLGVLAGLGLRSQEANDGARPVPIQLMNPNGRIRDLLDNMGIAHLFTTADGSAPAAHYAESSPCAHTPAEVSRTALEAHETLMSINPANVPKFKEVTQFLADDLKKLEAQTPTADFSSTD
jgi:anti-sigma B factor antagonist